MRARALVRRTDGTLASRIKAFIASLIEKRDTINCFYMATPPNGKSGRYRPMTGYWLPERSAALHPMSGNVGSSLRKFRRRGASRT
jgi:hypothetical protein